MIHALVIDDDAIARAYLCLLLHARGDVRVAGEAASLAEGRELIRRAACDLVFVDIALAGDSGFDLMADVSAGARVIFVSAHAEFALRAFEVNALDYLVKPFTPARLAAAIARLAPPKAESESRDDEIVHLRDGSRARITRIADICAIEAQENYSRVHLLDGSNVLVRRPLKSWEDVLEPSHFMRIHRTGIVNLARIRSYSRDPSGGVALQVQTLAHAMPVGRTYWTALKVRLAPGVQSLFPFASRRSSNQPWQESLAPSGGDAAESKSAR